MTECIAEKDAWARFRFLSADVGRSEPEAFALAVVLVGCVAIQNASRLANGVSLAFFPLSSCQSRQGMSLLASRRRKWAACGAIEVAQTQEFFFRALLQASQKRGPSFVFLMGGKQHSHSTGS